MSLTRLPVPERVNHLRPLRFVPKTPERRAHWICLCDCGEECIKGTTELRNGDAKSCGCKQYEAVAAGLSKALKKHGHSGENAGPEYRAWKAIHTRCYNEKHPKYPSYGGRGIKVCEAWRDFSQFLADMGPRPADKTSIDRLDVNKDYEPGNCEWADARQQARHRTDNVLIEYAGQIQCLSDWAEEVGLGRKTIRRRLDAGWSVERALTEKAWESQRA